MLTLLTVRHVLKEMDSQIEHALNNKICKLIKQTERLDLFSIHEDPQLAIPRVLVCFKVEIGDF